MTVSELIDKLQEMPPDYEGGDPIEFDFKDVKKYGIETFYNPYLKKMVIAIAVFVTACAKPVTTYVPIADNTKVDLGNAPTYTVFNLQDADKAHPDVVAKAYAGSFGECLADDQYIRSVCK